MFSFFIILIYVYCLYVGYRRGLAYEGLSALGYLISFIIAVLFYKPFSSLLTLWIPYPSANDRSRFAFFDQTTGLTLDKSFYAVIAFVIILLFFYGIWRIIMHGFNQLKFVEINKEINTLASILIALIITQIGVYLFLFILATIPSPGLQSALGKSILANSILRYTPGLSNFFINLFINAI
ncbi:CvpA family protein [Lactobacillus sp. PV034]|uniref:CvpA family protein n=1 Tax=Lactobacillus sp. PV034 TaxID=2594495 RepID=UPI0022406469|nr:CvpA family protein [Lactobacillus sp. PV034]QNQ81468.1 CvpA family protein [Lactobacillus sp. PV034]